VHRCGDRVDHGQHNSVEVDVTRRPVVSGHDGIGWIVDDGRWWIARGGEWRMRRRCRRIDWRGGSGRAQRTSLPLANSADLRAAAPSLRRHDVSGIPVQTAATFLSGFHARVPAPAPAAGSRQAPTAIATTATAATTTTTQYAS
jgi:hypothetical protein